MTATSALSPWRSQWLQGEVRHRRRAPVNHEFRYNTGMLCLNLAEWHQLDSLSRWLSVERFNWVSLYRRDYFLPEAPDLDTAVRDWVHDATGWRPDGAVELVTHPRYAGHVFNPVSFYFCYPESADPASGAVPRVILAQITNTPWKERHVYCLEPDTEQQERKAGGWQSVRFRFPKRFHVSPFNGMRQDYQWLFSFRDDQLRIHMNVYENGEKQFDATLAIQRQPLTRKIFHQALRRFPLECAKVVTGIYWHALRLKLKGAPFYTHPDKLPEDCPEHALGRDDTGRLLPGSAGTAAGSTSDINSDSASDINSNSRQTNRRQTPTDSGRVHSWRT
ncbi:DUF1365 domain-containing protein [Marinobacter xestospongiae]|uniref:DUF1365 domain-containing protein n=1 Tax=Marinobacter xestospongiae TaxID=994319 RepID=UPI002004CB1C|nr:DUF1365 domain-containing protein [Marinobacter xestospongiae]MCK7566226.1 DUF1365 domain-containing protein [Marinobacter xestospongiae]